MNDNELMLKVRDGNKDAYEIIMNKYMTQAISFANKYVHDSFAAEDIVQDSFVDVYMQRLNFKQEYQFSTYLYAIVKNKSINYLKMNKEILMSSFSETMEIQIEEKKFINLSTPETQYFQKAEHLQLLSTIHRLNADERNMLYLYAVDECSYKEIAEKSGKTVAQVKIKIFRLRKKLKKWGEENHE